MTRLGLLCLAALLGLAPGANATVINFDNIVTGSTVVALPAGYGGINWTDPNFGVYGFTDGIYTSHTPSNRVLTDRLSIGQTAISFGFVTPVVFDGAWFVGSSAAGNVSFTMSYQNLVVASSSSITLTPSYTFLSSGYNGLVDKITINGIGGFFVFDDVTYHTPGVIINEVPEPSSAALLVLPMIGLAFTLRRHSSRGGARPAN